MYVANARGAEPGTVTARVAPPRLEKPRGQGVEVLRREPCELNGAERRQHVEFDRPSVGVEGGRLELAALSREPPLREVRACRHLLRSAVFTIVVALDELGDELVGVRFASPGRMPTTSLFAGRRVDPFIDHRVVPGCPSSPCNRAS